MNEIASDVTYLVTDNKVTFHEVTAEQKGADNWLYTETGPWFRQRLPKELSEEFLLKAKALQQENKLGEVALILCNAAYAVALYIDKIITKEMILSLDQKVAGAGRDMITLIIIPLQEILLCGQKCIAKIYIVNCFSYSKFVFIDRNNKDM